MSTGKRYSARQKVEILREHLTNNLPISTLCERYGFSPQILQIWKKQLFEGALDTFTKPKGKQKREASKLEHLQKKLNDRDSLIGELVSENIRLKKSLNGDL
ncbi:MAG: transposase [bacterium]